MRSRYGSRSAISPMSPVTTSHHFMFRRTASCSTAPSRIPTGSLAITTRRTWGAWRSGCRAPLPTSLPERIDHGQGTIESYEANREEGDEDGSEAAGKVGASGVWQVPEQDLRHRVALLDWRGVAVRGRCADHLADGGQLRV